MPHEEDHCLDTLETAPPLTMTEYTNKFSSLLTRDSNEEHTTTEIVRSVIRELDREPVTLLSIGAGRGNLELKMVRELGLRVKFVYAVEPNVEHVRDLESALRSIGCQFEVDKSYYSKYFEVELKGEYTGGFDLVLMSHCLYCIPDPNESAVRATKFLNSTGKLFIIHHGGLGSAEVFSYLVSRSNPAIFSPEKCVADHSVTAHQISSFIKTTCPELSVTVIEKPTYTDMDEFVRETDDVIRNDDVISFFLQAEYMDLSLRGRQDVYEIVKEGCDMVDGRYRMRHQCVGIVVTRSCDVL